MTSSRSQVRTLLATMLLAWCGVAAAILPSMDVLNAIQPGITTAEEVRERLGPPDQNPKYRDGTQDYEYTVRDFGTRVLISIGIGKDGKVKNIMKMGPALP